MIQAVLEKISRASLGKRKSGRLSKIVEEHFDATYYHQHNPDLGASDDALTHYVRHGWKEGRDPTEWFSVRDYLATYPDIAAANVDPFEHYLKHGKGEGRLARPAQGSESRGAREFAETFDLHLQEFPKGFDAQVYALAAGLAPDDRWQALSHFMQDGIFRPRLFAIAQPDAALLSEAGDYYLRSDTGKALQCFQLAEQYGEADSWLMHKIGDCHLNLNQPINARTAFLKSLEKGGNFYWTFYNLGTIGMDLGEYDFAIEYFKAASKNRPEKHLPRQSHRNAASERFHVQWIQANGLATAGNDDAASLKTSAAILAYQNEFSDEDIAPSPVGGDRPFRSSIAIFGSDSLPQCKLYRITQKLDQLTACGVSVDFFPLDKGEELSKNFLKYDSLILYRAPALPEVIDVILGARKFGLETYYDIDDLIFDDSCYPPSREALGDMVSPTEYAGLVTGRTLFREAMAMCDYGIASTPPLQDAMAKIVRCKQCFLSRNALGRSHIKQIERIAQQKFPPKNKFVFFYGSGSRSHNENFAIIAKPLAALMRKHGNVQLQIFGPLTLGKEFDGVRRQIRHLDFTTDLSQYWQALAAADVNLAPLTSSTFNDGKSEIKWMEAAMLGIPSIVSSSAVYDSVIRDGQDGFAARSEADWASTLGNLVKNPELCQSIGERARTRVMTDYAIQSGGENLLSILNTSVKQHSENLSQLNRKGPLVVVVNIFYPPEYIGGATRVVEQTVTDVLEAEHETVSIEIFCGREPDGKPGAVDRYVWNDVPVTSLSPFSDQDSIERSVDTEALFSAYLDYVRPDIIHFHCIQRLGASLIDVAAQRNIPYLVSVHDGWWISDQQFLIEDNGVPVYESENWGEPRRLDRLKASLNGAYATIAVSKTLAHIYEERGVANVITIANGSETLPDVPSPPLHGPVWLGLLGGLGMAKGADLLREVLRRHTYQNLRFLVVDHSMLEGSVRYEQWGENRIEIIGKASFANVAKVYARLHAVLAISVCIESFGLVAREAQRLGRWVIASDRGGMAEDVVAETNGYVVDPSKMDDLIGVFDKINADPARYRVAPPKGLELRGRREVASDFASLYHKIWNEIGQKHLD